MYADLLDLLVALDRIPQDPRYHPEGDALYHSLQVFQHARRESRDPALVAAALLHDVGQLVSYRKHHKHSYQLIIHADRLPFSPRERQLVALISRYHRRRGPRKQHAVFGVLPKPDQQLVRRLAGMLRVAEGLDRGHTAIVEKLALEFCPTRLTIKAVPRYAGADLALECWGAEEQADVLARVMAREVKVEPAV